MVVSVPAMPMSALVELVNGWGSSPRTVAGEDTSPYPPQTALGAAMETLKAAGPVADKDLQELADQLHEIFERDDVRLRANLVTDLLRRSRVIPALQTRGDDVYASWFVNDPRDAWLAAACVALRDLIADQGIQRLGVCSGERCADVYVDTSPSRGRRFCSVTCQNRARSAAFRRRERIERQREL